MTSVTNLKILYKTTGCCMWDFESKHDSLASVLDFLFSASRSLRLVHTPARNERRSSLGAYFLAANDLLALQ